MIRIFCLLLLLAYFWYWTATTLVRNVPKPSSHEPIVPDAPSYSLESDGRNVNVVVDGRTEWKVELPEETVLDVDEQKLSAKDDCFGIPDGSSILASGEKLYKHLRKHDVDSTRHFQASSAPGFLQKGNVFYFTCLGGKIDRLEMCPSGQIYLDGRCQNINPCLDKPPGYTFADTSSFSSFYKCPGNDAPAEYHRCQEDTYFFHDSCRKLQDFDLFCQGTEDEKEIIAIDAATRIVCQKDGKAAFKKCPIGQIYFDGVCESSRCLGQPDGTRIGSSQKRRGHLVYNPGYSVCRNDRVEQTVECPTQWDKNLAIDQAALTLPQVFNGLECTVPKVCDNFWPVESDAVVPVYDFTKYVRNWQHSRDVDNKVGYTCNEEGTKRTKVGIPHGHLIDSKSFKTYESLREKTFMSDRFDAYYDRSKEAVVPCEPNEIFDGVDCRPKIENAFSHGGLGLFRMSDEEWIRGWGYLSNREPVPNCTEPESVYLETYNACFHPDCVSYPFLSQLRDSFIALEESGQACRGTSLNLVSKTPIDSSFDYWTQRRIDEPTDEEKPCVPGSKIQSGHFVFDSIIYATCDPSQPFVFCPYRKTDGISLVEGKRWACKPRNAEMATLKANTMHTFEANELKSIRMLYFNTVADIDGIQTEMQGDVEIEENKPVTVWATNDILLVFRYVHTFPPDVAYKNGRPILSNIDEGGALLMKRNGFTSKPVKLPKFSSAAATVADFDVGMK